jgi:Rrf2 family transcriptional regulator, nitric oxide-sensitive transcriptional repressor
VRDLRRAVFNGGAFAQSRRCDPFPDPAASQCGLLPDGTKVISRLAAAGVVATQRGSGGGFRLARAPADLSIGEIVRLLETGEGLVECFRADGGACCLRPECKLRGRLAAAREAFLRELDRTTLAECAYPVPSASRGGAAA